MIRESSGGIHNSRFGVRGTEAISNGTSVWFVLEAGFNSNDGTSATAGTLFNRTAAVWVSNNRVGSLSFGLQYTAMYDILLQYDPMGYAPQYTWFPTTGSSDDFAFRARNDNTVKYVGQFGRLTAIGQYSFGNDAGSFQSSAAYGGGLNYDGGSFGAALAYDYRNGAINSSGTWTKSRNFSLTFRQNIGAAKLLGGYEHYLYTPTRSASEAQALWFADVRYPVQPQWTVTAAAYYEQNDTPKTSNAWMGVLSTQYALSKRTSLYATVAYAQATRYGNGQYTPVGTTDATAFGPNQTGVTLGMFHRF
ncbi:porin [Burkholderia sp. WAC0059]|uniref:porin n=1 Tax=Burkholderia sp. WAC0059 TaxID=2066022 RepID=UPI000C7ED473|nr:porin [Burkholderia sp. WAC0059]PLZ00025.1 porin [Burkholderia sp. WAC0059]